ncbi:hypothetical protein SDC9_98294 [bioreactor metagenome]|uniref:Uncharacterized protein n=1 Tax=bioreactor metagenome TaxID=1076179 RepID=A0A645AEC0_9ZZZZ
MYSLLTHLTREEMLGLQEASSLNQFRLLQMNLMNVTLLFPEIELLSTSIGFSHFRMNIKLQSEDLVMLAKVTSTSMLVKREICLLMSSQKKLMMFCILCMKKLLKWVEKSQVSMVSDTAR